MLKSVGMTKKGLHKMMNYECAFYGIKGLIFGMIAAVVYLCNVQGYGKRL